MLNVVRLRVLKEVAYRGSLSGAADALSYTQSAISQQIATLEAEAGMALLERHPRGVSLTAAGQTLLGHAEGILARLDAADAALTAIAGLRGGRLRMASFPTAGATLMPLAIATFRSSYPDVELTLAEGEPEEIGPRLQAGEFDLALVFKFAGVGERLGVGLRTVELLEDPMHVVLPADHPLARKRALKLGDLRREDWVQTSEPSPCARHVVRLCLTAGFEPNVTFESDDYETVQGLVAAGVGVALVPRLALTHVHPGIVVRELSPRSPARTVVAATMAGPGVAPAARTMLRILTDVARDYAATPEQTAEVAPAPLSAAS